MSAPRWEVWVDGWCSPRLRSSRQAAMNAAMDFPRAELRVVRHAGRGERWANQGRGWFRQDDPVPDTAPRPAPIERSLPERDRE